MSPTAIILFYLAAFATGFGLCIMPGPIALEVVHHAIKRQPLHALCIGAGAAIGDALWAMVAFYGITPFLQNSNSSLVEGLFLLVAAILTFVIGLLAVKDAKLATCVEKKEEEIAQKIVKRKRKRWSVLKGLMLVLVNPLGIGSWVIILSVLKKANVYIPLEFTYEVVFYGAVMAGAFSYSVLIVLIAKKIQDMFTPERISKISKVLGYLLILFSLYFLWFSLRALIFSRSSLAELAV